MNRFNLFRLVLIGFLAGGLGIGGCGSTKPSRLYTLRSLPREATASVKEGGPSIGIGPVKFPAYLERSEIVTRDANGKIEAAESDRWAGSLGEDFARVVAENLSILLSTERVFVYPPPRSIPIDYQLWIDVIRFEGLLGREVELIARWSILGGRDRHPKGVHQTRVREPMSDPSYEALVAAESRAVEKLSREIAQALNALPK